MIEPQNLSQSLDDFMRSKGYAPLSEQKKVEDPLDLFMQSKGIQPVKQEVQIDPLDEFMKAKGFEQKQTTGELGGEIGQVVATVPEEPHQVVMRAMKPGEKEAVESGAYQVQAAARPRKPTAEDLRFSEYGKFAKVIDPIGQFITNYVDMFLWGFPEMLTKGVFKEELPKPISPVGEVAGGLGALGGLAGWGGTSAAAFAPFRVTGTVLKRVFKKPAETVVGKLVQNVAKNVGTLGLAMGAVEWKGEDPVEVLKNKVAAVKSGAFTGAVFGGTQFINFSNAYPLLSHALRFGTTSAILDLARGTTPWDERSFFNKAFDYGLNLWFTREGLSPKDFKKLTNEVNRAKQEAKEEGLDPTIIPSEEVIKQKIESSEIPIPEEALIPKGTAGTVGGYETRGVPTEFQPQPKPEMGIPENIVANIDKISTIPEQGQIPEIPPTKPVEARLPETPTTEPIPAQKLVVAPPSPKKGVRIPIASAEFNEKGGVTYKFEFPPEILKPEIKPIATEVPVVPEIKPGEIPKPEVIPPEIKPAVEIVETKPPITVAKPVQEYLGEVKKPIPTERVFTVGQKFASKSGGYFEVTDISNPEFITAKSPKGTLFKFDRKTVQPVEQIKKPLPTLEELRTRTTPLTGKWGQKHYQYLKDQAEAYNKEHLDIPIEQLVMTPLEKEKITLFEKLNVPEGNKTDLWKAIAPFDVAHPKADLEHYTNLAIKKMFDKTKRSINGEWLLKRDLRHKYIKIGEEKVPIESATRIPVEKVSEPMMGEKIKGPEAELMAKETIDQIKERIRLNVAEGPNEQRDIKIMNDAILNLKSHKEIAEDLAKTEAGITEERVRQIFKDNVKYLKDDPKMKNLLKDFTEQNFTYLYCGYPIVPELKTAIKGFVDKIVSRRSNILKEMEKNPLPEEVASDSITKVITALKEAKPIRKEQEILYSKERAQRMARSLEIAKEIRGEKGFYAEKRAFAGELPKTTKFESIRPELMQEDIDNIFNQVKDSKNLTEWEKLPARNGLVKLFAPEGTFVPTEGELKLLNRVFPPEFTKAILSKTATWDKIKRYGYELLNLPRTAMASFDLSAALRQGIFFVGHPKQFFDSFIKMFNYFGSDKAFKGLMEDIRSKPNYDLKMKSGVAFSEMDSILQAREEKMMGADLAEKIPLYGIGVRASNRAYTGFLNKLRDSMFDHFYNLAERQGLNPSENLELTRNIADLVNCGTGRGSLGKFQKSAVFLNSTLFAPRLMASRLKLLNPVFYMKLDPFTRQEALKTLFSFASFGMGVLGLASLAGLKVGTNPLSADFGKMKVDDTRIDIWGGFSPYVRTAVQFAWGKTVSSTTGKITMVGEGYHPLTRFDILARFIEQKEAPVLSFAMGLLKGANTLGEKFSISKELANRFTPMVVQDTIDIYKQDPKLLPLSSLGIFGIGLQTYSKNKIDVLSSRYFDKGDRTAYDEANVYIKSLPVEEQERTRKRFMMGKKIKDIPEEERGYWMFLSGLNPERRAKYFYDKYIEKTGTEKEQMMRDARKIGGILSDRFLKEFKRLQKENK